MNHLNLEQFLQTKITNDHYDEIAILMPRNVFIWKFKIDESCNNLSNNGKKNISQI